MTGTPDEKESGALLKVLTAHYHALVAARSDDTVLRQFAALLRYMKSGNARFLHEAPQAKRDANAQKALPTLSDEDLRKASLDDLQKLIEDESTPRKNLEKIAIQRFSVPRGSMRSFSNKQMLIDKLHTLIGNERTHMTIGAVARRQADEKPGD